jgi:hypothetical protein
MGHLAQSSVPEAFRILAGFYGFAHFSATFKKGKLPDFPSSAASYTFPAAMESPSSEPP